MFYFSIIQKTYYRKFGFMSGFIDALRLEKFSDENFKIWQMRAIL
jgi:hypothetical protein